MREVTDEALQRLYWACRRGSGFPGPIPDESTGSPSTAAILDALGLKPPLEDAGQPMNPQNRLTLSNSPSLTHQQPMSPSSSESPTKAEYLPSPTQSCFSITSAAHQQKSGPYLASTNDTSITPTTPLQIGIYEQCPYSASEHATSHSKPITNSVDDSYTESSSSLNFDMDTYLDTSSCSMPLSVAHPIYSMQNATQLEHSEMMEFEHIIHPMNTTSSQSDPICEDYLSPWPESLAVGCQTAATVR